MVLTLFPSVLTAVAPAMPPGRIECEGHEPEQSVVEQVSFEWNLLSDSSKAAPRRNKTQNQQPGFPNQNKERNKL